MAVEMAAEADRHVSQMAAWAREAREAEAAIRQSAGEAACRRAGSSVRAREASCDGWREEVRRNLQAAFERAAARQAGA